MVILYNTSTLSIDGAWLDNGSSGYQEALLTDVAVGASQDVFAITDDADVVQWPTEHIVWTSGPVPCGVNKRKTIQLTISPTSIFPNETASIAVQLLDENGNPDSAVVDVTLYVGQGIITPATVTTNGSGYNDEAVYRPAKYAGDVYLDASASGYMLPPSEQTNHRITIKSPTTDAEQNWAQTADIKDGAVDVAKLSDGVNIKLEGASNQSFYVEPYLVDQYYVGIKSGANAIVNDNDGYFYVVGLDNGGDQLLKKVDRADGTVIATATFVGSTQILPGTAAGYPTPFAFDGAHIITAQQDGSSTRQHVVKIKTSNLSTVMNFDLSATVSNIYAVHWDGEAIWIVGVQTVTAYEGVWRLDPSDGSVLTSYIYGAPGLGDGQSYGRCMAMTKTKVVFVYDASSLYVVVYTKATNAFARFVVGGNQLGPIVSDGKYLYIGCKNDPTAGLQKIDLDTSTVVATAAVGYVYALIFDGTHLWLINYANNTSTLERWSTDLVQTNSFTLETPASMRYALSYDGQYLYVADTHTIET